MRLAGAGTSAGADADDGAGTAEASEAAPDLKRDPKSHTALADWEAKVRTLPLLIVSLVLVECP